MGARDVFADTSALYSLIDRNEASHAAVKRATASLVAKGASLVVSDYIVAEAVNLANARGGHHVGCRILELVQSSAGIKFTWIGASRFHEAQTLFHQRPLQRYSFTDCTSFVLMSELGLRTALTLDRHFLKAGFTVLPSP